MSVLTGKKIVLGVSGSIAAYKVAELARNLTLEGAIVDVIMTEAARAVESEGYERLAKVEASMERFISEKGAKIVYLTPDNVADWRACSADMVIDYMDRNGELARRLMAAYSQLRTDPCCTAGPSEGTFTRR